MTDKICECKPEDRFSDGCSNCGHTFCGEYDENMARYGQPIIGCGRQVMLCTNCGGLIK
jgi:hypothetical protein